MGLKTTPVFNVTGPYQHVYNTRASMILLTDNPGYQSDTLKITLNSQGAEHNIKAGDQIRLEWGYQGENALIDMGLFNVIKAKPLFLPSRLEVIATANAQHINAPSKARRSQTYSNTTVFDVVSQIAARLNLNPKVHNALSSNVLVHLDQKNESDLSFLQRLAASYDAVAKVYDGNLIFAPRGQIKNQAGQAMETINLIVPSSPHSAPYNAIKTLTVEITETEQFLGVKADYYQTDLAKNQTVEIGQAPFAQLPGRFSDEAKANDAIKAEFSRIKRQSLKCQFSVPGDPLIMSEAPINIQGANDRVDGDWSCDQVEHRWTPGNFETSVSASAVIR